MKKTFIIIGISISTIIIVFLVWLMIFLAQNGYNSLSFDNTANLHIEKEQTFEVNDIKNINLNFASADIVIFTTDENTCKIIQQSNRILKESELFNISQNGDTVEIQTKHKLQIFNFGFITNYSRIEIYLPKTYSQNLDINAVSGDILINSDLTLCNLAINAISGDINNNSSLQTEKYTLSTVSGDIHLGNLLGSGSINTVSGDVKIGTLNILDNSSLKTTSGDINLAFISIKNNFNVNTISGDIKLNFTMDANCKINYSTVSGNLSSNTDILYGGDKKSKIINIGDKDTANSINISTVSGDLTIN